jgi:hypothetical protein
VALVVTLATMVLACDLSLPAGMFMPTILWGALLVGRLKSSWLLSFLESGLILVTLVLPGLHCRPDCKK